MCVRANLHVICGIFTFGFGTDGLSGVKASGEISKEEAENIIAGIAIYDDEDFDEPEYDEEGHVTGVVSEASSASPERKAKSTPEEIAAKKVRKVLVEVAVTCPLGMAAYP